MVREKTVSHQDAVAHRYSSQEWGLLRALRARAEEVAAGLPADAALYGSVARGDVHHGSDVDIVLLDPSASLPVQVALEAAGLEPTARSIVQATPGSVPKAHIALDDRTTVTFPLAPFRRTEEEFYRFGGLLPVSTSSSPSMRVPGVTKRLTLIEPTDDGHRESSVIGREPAVAALLGIGVDLVHERIRVLKRRDRVGRTGVYLRVELAPGDSFEGALAALAAADPAIRRTTGRRRGGTR